MEGSFVGTVNQTPGHDNGIFRTENHMHVMTFRSPPARLRAAAQRPCKRAPEERASEARPSRQIDDAFAVFRKRPQNQPRSA